MILKMMIGMRGFIMSDRDMTDEDWDNRDMTDEDWDNRDMADKDWKGFA